MNKELLKKVGMVLYPGPQWKGKLAKELGVHKSTIANWARGDYPVPGDKQQELFWLVELRLKAMRKLVNEQLGRVR